MKKIDKNQCYLSSPKYGYDMVVGITEEAINSQMADYLDFYEGPEVIQWYSQGGPNQPYQVIDPIDDLGLDIFDLEPDENGKLHIDREILKPLFTKLKEHHFVAAVKARLGWSSEEEDSPNVINFDKGIEEVTFKMFFSEFQMVSLSFDWDGYCWNKEQQNPDEPYVFDYLVDLKFASGKFEDLEQAQQKQLVKINPASAWSVQQLYLDLTSAALQKQPHFDSGKMGTIVQDFVNSSAWNKLMGGERLVLANTVKKLNTDPINKPSMVPTYIKLGISGFIEKDDKHNNKSPLTTLNYLMMTDNDPPITRQFVGFDWNWVGEKDKSEYNGCMAIKREKFVQFLRDMLCGKGSTQGPINEICFLPSTTAYISHFGETKFTAGLSVDHSHISGLKASPSGAQVLSLQYAKHHESHDDNWNTPEVENELRYTLTFTVSLVGNEIRMTIHSEIYSRIKADLFNAGGSSGRIGGYNLNPVYSIGVQSDGRLFASLKKGTDKLTPVPKDVSSSFLASLSGSSDLLSKEADNFDTFARNHLQGFQNSINEFLQNSGQLFIFPGGKTFTFKNPTFSDHQDLIAELTYNQV